MHPILSKESLQQRLSALRLTSDFEPLEQRSLSYSNSLPGVQVNSPHAYTIESVEVQHAGNCKYPVESTLPPLRPSCDASALSAFTPDLCPNQCLVITLCCADLPKQRLQRGVTTMAVFKAAPSLVQSRSPAPKQMVVPNYNRRKPLFSAPRKRSVGRHSQMTFPGEDAPGTGTAPFFSVQS